MAEFKFPESTRSFTSPVRKFKANDPYYYEVDNIPLGQLEENDLFLLDQLTGLKLTGVGRSDINELRPWATGGDNSVRVKPGRYIARINDAYGKTYKQLSDPHFIPEPGSLFNGSFFGGQGKYVTLSTAQAIVQDNIIKFKTGVAANIMSLNGLLERILSHTQDTTSFGNIPAAGMDPSSLVNTADPDFPGVNNYESIWLDIQNQFSTNALSNLSRLAAEFSRRWGGAIRTALVDVPSELSIPVPAFNASDFYYLDENGQSVTIPNAEQATRIDLVFIYSSPADEASTTIISKGSKQEINTPKLGLVAGAGLSLDLSKFTEDAGPSDTITTSEAQIISTEGVDSQLGMADVKMLPNVADSFMSTGGFVTESGTRIYGSIPSPDDIMNLSPLLFENLENDDYRLIGQTVLPIAYIVRKAGSVTVSPEEVVDIRPFFRTTELTYNERAGIAAAGPPLSMANPAVGRKELAKHITDFKSNVVDQIHSPEGNAIWTGAAPNFPRIIGGGYVWGGTKWGPEGAILTTFDAGGEEAWWNTQGYGVPLGAVPEMPDWDLATWITTPGEGAKAEYSNAGGHRNDRINWKSTHNAAQKAFYGNDEPSVRTATLDFGDADKTGIDDIDWLQSYYKTAGNMDDMHAIGTTMGAPRHYVKAGKYPNMYQMHWISKRINFLNGDGGQGLPPGFSNYDVDITFTNCLPLVSQGNPMYGHKYPYSTVDQFPSTSTGFWIYKGKSFFDINIGIPGHMMAQVHYSNYHGFQYKSNGKSYGAGFCGLGQEIYHDAGSKFAGNGDLFKSRNSVYLRQFSVPLPTDTPFGARRAGYNLAEDPINYAGNHMRMNPAFAVPVNLVGTCTYPTIQYRITGYPNGYAGFNSATDGLSAGSYLKDGFALVV